MKSICLHTNVGASSEEHAQDTIAGYTAQSFCLCAWYEPVTKRVHALWEVKDGGTIGRGQKEVLFLQSTRRTAAYAAMKTFDIGFVPRGWERGEELLWMNATPTTRGYVKQDPAFFSVSSEPRVVDAIYALRFTYEEMPRVEAWLKWWQE